MINKTILHYKILEELGRGGMGVVYKAEDTQLQREVAIKFLPDHITASYEERERFKVEARAAAALNHPNIATIHAIEEPTAGKPGEEMFIVMEYIDGQEIKKMISSAPLKLEKALDIAIQIGHGLQAAHEKEIVHRDIKNANIMVTKKGQVKVMDFGLAKLAGQVKLTKTNTTVGTIAFMSPEQAQGNDVDQRSDIFSFGAVIYEMITGQHPFKGDYEQAVLYSILNEEPEPVTALRTGIPLELERIVNKAMAKSPAERYQHVEEMLVDLKALQKSQESGISKKTQPSAAHAPQSKPSRQPVLLAAGVAIFALVVVLGVILFRPAGTDPGDRKSIAVLPFDNMNQDQESEYFSNGITEDILTQLSKIGDLRVISRTSSMRYKDSQKSLREIGKELGVATILEGSIRRDGNKVRIVGQLIDARSDEHIWAETYDREMKDIFAVQSDVAKQIAAALKATLSPAEQAQIEKQPTQNLSAYDFYLKGRDYYGKYRKQDNENAIELFKKALELDPDYVLAYAGLGDAYAQRPWRFGLAWSWLDSSVAMSKKGLAIDPNSAECYKSLGLAYEYLGFYELALEATLKAIEFNPNFKAAIGNVGWINWFLGKYDEALRWMQKELLVDPTNAHTYYGIGLVYAHLDEFEKAEELQRKALDLQPDLEYAHWTMTRISILQGKFQEARDRSEKYLQLDPDGFNSLWTACDVYTYSGEYKEAIAYCERAAEIDPIRVAIYLGLIYTNLGRKAEAQKQLELARDDAQQAMANGNEYGVLPFIVSKAFAIEGEHEKALNFLRKAVDSGLLWYRYLAHDPAYAELKDHEEFQEILAEIGGRVDEMRRTVNSKHLQ